MCFLFFVPYSQLSARPAVGVDDALLLGLMSSTPLFPLMSNPFHLVGYRIILRHCSFHLSGFLGFPSPVPAYIRSNFPSCRPMNCAIKSATITHVIKERQRPIFRSSGLTFIQSLTHFTVCVYPQFYPLIIFYSDGNINAQTQQSVTYMSQYCSLNSSHSLLLPLTSKVRSLQLCLLCCPARRIVSTIFLDSIYMH